MDSDWRCFLSYFDCFSHSTGANEPQFVEHCCCALRFIIINERRWRSEVAPFSSGARRLTVHRDLRLLRLSGVNAGDVAAVRAAVIDVDPLDGQDAGDLREVRQSLAVGLRVRPAVCLQDKNGPEAPVSRRWAARSSNLLPVCTSLPGYDHWISSPVLNSTSAVQFSVRVSPAISSTGSTGNSLTS